MPLEKKGVKAKKIQKDSGSGFPLYLNELKVQVYEDVEMLSAFAHLSDVADSF